MGLNAQYTAAFLAKQQYPDQIRPLSLPGEIGLPGTGQFGFVDWYTRL